MDGFITSELEGSCRGEVDVLCIVRVVSGICFRLPIYCYCNLINMLVHCELAILLCSQHRQNSTNKFMNQISEEREPGLLRVLCSFEHVQTEP